MLRQMCFRLAITKFAGDAPPNYPTEGGEMIIDSFEGGWGVWYGCMEDDSECVSDQCQRGYGVGYGGGGSLCMCSHTERPCGAFLLVFDTVYCLTSFCNRDHIP